MLQFAVMILTHRRKKQLLYSLLLTALPLAFIFGALTLYTFQFAPKPPSVAPPTNDQYQPIKVEATTIIRRSTTSRFESQIVDIVTPLRNSNARSGVREFTVNYLLYDDNGQEITRTSDTVYILPGALQYAMVLALPIPGGVRIGQIEVTTTPHNDIAFIDVPDLNILPNFSLFLREREERQIGSTTVTNQTGIITNAGTFPWQTVEIRAVALGESRNIIAAGKTFAGALQTGEQREFTVQWPKAQGDIQQVVAVPSTNIFRDDNFIRAIGNPASLR